MKIGFIGAGKVGFSLGKFFAQGSIPVTGYHSRHRENAEKAARFTDSRCYDELKALVSDSDVLFLTVSDAAISEVFQTLTKFDLSGKQICHCSGALTAREAFPGIECTGATGCSVHPLFPVSSKYEAYRELAGAFFCVEGDEAQRDAWCVLLRSLGARARCMDGADKVRYHAACTVAGNLMCALSQVSLELLAVCDFTERDALDALAPLMRSNLEHILQSGPTEALTGPAERGDAGTIARHLDVLSDGERMLYCTATEKLLEMAKCKHPERDYGALQNILKQEMDKPCRKTP